MKGIGTDIVQISRIQQTLDKQGDRFIHRILTAAEQQIYVERRESVTFLANRFAGKEAVAKALGTGIANGIRFDEIEILPDAAGCPQVRLTGRADEKYRQLGADGIHISLSDEREYAVAFVVLS